MMMLRSMGRFGSVGLGVDPVDFDALRFVKEEGLVDAPGKPMVEIGGVYLDDQEMLGVGDTVGSVVNHWLIAIEGETVVGVRRMESVATSLRRERRSESGGQAGGRSTSDRVPCRRSRVRRRGLQNGYKCNVADLCDSPAADSKENDGSEEERGGAERSADWTDGTRVSYSRCCGARTRTKTMTAQFLVGPEEPFWKALAANAVQIIGRKDGEWRDRRRNT